jgi:urea transport system ATP-binding protein
MSDAAQRVIERYRVDDPRQTQLWDHKYLLFVSGITAVFDGFKALDIEALGIEHKELRVIIGPNGAGKTTLCDVISGKTLPASGGVFYSGQEITRLSETEIAQRGIRRKFQTPTVFGSLTTYENMELALPGREALWGNLSKKETAEERDRIMALLERVRLMGRLHTQAKYLSHGERQWLAIATLILSDPKLLLVDEPAAGLTDSETELTAELLMSLKKEHTLIVIEHDMTFVRQLASTVTVLNEGKIMDEGMLEDVQKNKDVIEAYLGR